MVNACTANYKSVVSQILGASIDHKFRVLYENVPSEKKAQIHTLKKLE